MSVYGVSIKLSETTNKNCCYISAHAGSQLFLLLSMRLATHCVVLILPLALGWSHWTIWAHCVPCVACASGSLDSLFLLPVQAALEVTVLNAFTEWVSIVIIQHPLEICKQAMMIKYFTMKNQFFFTAYSVIFVVCATGGMQTLIFEKIWLNIAHNLTCNMYYRHNPCMVALICFIKEL